MRLPCCRMFSGVFAGKTVSICALNATYRLPKPGCVPNTLPTSSMRTSSSPTSRNFSDSHAARADSPNGGAGIRAISICHCRNCASRARNQLNAERTSGAAAIRATSCCTEGARSGNSARGGLGLMSGYGLVYNTAKHAQALANTGLFEDRRTLVVTADRLIFQGTKMALPTSVVAGLFPRSGYHWEDNDFADL